MPRPSSTDIRYMSMAASRPACNHRRSAMASMTFKRPLNSHTVLSASAARGRSGDPYPAMGSRQELRAAGAEEFQHGACRRQQDLVLPGKNEPLPDNGKANHVERDQPPLVEFGGNGVSRNKCNSETRDHSLLDGLVAVHR